MSRKRGFTGAGLSTLLLVFVMLCLIVFSVLSLLLFSWFSFVFVSWDCCVVFIEMF